MKTVLLCGFWVCGFLVCGFLALATHGSPFLPQAIAAAPTVFLQGMKDVPLMPGFAEMPDKLVIFDKPNGLIVENEAAGAASWDEVVQFYRASLPQLGWRPLAGKSSGAGAALLFKRAGERLEITAAKANPQAGPVTLHFSLTPD